ncbi:MAG: S-methyl-5'-thioadenosine phosphorylase [Deltaproteobacteria bacterium]|nr:S-methyl-5'-thioadenosine phosphorylase [Deltaproteobacteria bacterium]
MNETANPVVGIVGGSGLYELEGLKGVDELKVKTPFGSPSSPLIVGTLDGSDGRPVKLAFLPRHGRGHAISPSEINYRANVHALKQLGAEWIISVSAVGSMRDEIEPGHIVIPNQFFDRTRSRGNSFFRKGCVAHVGFADPVCGVLADALHGAAKTVGATVHKGGTYVVMEGPAFSTRAESRIYRQWGVDVIGMTALPEAKLAREAEICYATLALSTDYDCWHESEEDVTVEAVVATIKKNVATAKAIVAATAKLLPRARTCACPNALRGAIMTDAKAIPATTREKLRLLIGRYVK